MIGARSPIAGAAGQAASAGLSTLLIFFLTMLSGESAVINFLPIPLPGRRAHGLSWPTKVSDADRQ